MGINNSQDPSSFGWKVADQIVPFTYPGIVPVSFPGGVAAAAVPLFTALLNELVPHINGGLKAGSCWGFENRNNVNSPGKKSFHAYGLALDINADANPNGSSNKGKAVGKFQLPPETEGIAQKYGCEWLGDSDPMHIEVHIAPNEIPTYTGGVSGAIANAGTSVATGVGSSLSNPKGLAIIAGVAVIGAVIVFSGGLGN